MTIIEAIEKLKSALVYAKTYGTDRKDEVKALQVAIGILYEYYTSLPEDTRDTVKF